MKRAFFVFTILSLLALAFGGVPALAAPAEKVDVLIGFSQPPGQAEQALVRGLGGEIKYTYSIIPTIAASVPGAAIPGLLRNPRITHIEADGRAYAVQETLPWGVDRIDAEVVHTDTAGNKGAGVHIAIIDTGIGPHPDLYVNGGHRFLNGGGISDSNYADDNGHGTHCAGIAAALDNDIGVIGVAPEASLYAVKVLDSSGSGYYSDIIAGIEWCITSGMQVISMSLGGSTTSTDLENICNEAYGSGIVLVAAAGNSGNPPGIGDNINYPARYDSVIAVAATDQNDSRARWSSTGLAAELSAPGVNIYSTYLNNSYYTASGTSMACPHVSGVAALVKVSNSSLTNVQVRERLQVTADDLGATGWDEKYGYGLVDADGAALAPAATNSPPVADAGGPYAETVGDPVTFDGSGSSDPDGNLLTYDWDFGDGETGLGMNPTHTYTAAGQYNVTLVVNDGIIDSAPATTTATISEGTTTSNMHVGNIDVTYTIKKAGKNTFYTGVAEVIVVDADGAPVEGVAVYGDWSDLASDSDSGITDANGMVTLTSNSVKIATGTFTFTVVNLVKSSWNYDFGSNVETSDSITIP